MIRITASAEVAAPVERVWHLYDDIPNTPAWVPFVEEVLSIDGGPGVGTVYRERTRLGGSTGEQEWRITEHEAPHRTVHVSTDMGMNARLIITFEALPPAAGGADSGRTLLRQTTELRSRLPRPFAWLHEALVATVARTGIRRAVRAAKAHLEGDPGA